MVRRLALLAVACVAAGFWLTVWPQRLPDAPRDVRMPAQGRDGPVAIVVFGTSLTARATWPDMLVPALAECGLDQATVHRVARIGANSDEGAAAIAAFGSRSVDVAIIEYAINDADLWDGLSRQRSIDNHTAMVGTLRALNPDIGILLLATNPVRGLQIMQRPLLADYYETYPTLAAELGLGFVDGFALWRTASRADFGDGLHPDPGVEASLYVEPLRDQIAQSRGVRCPG